MSDFFQNKPREYDDLKTDTQDMINQNAIEASRMIDYIVDLRFGGQ